MGYAWNGRCFEDAPAALEAFAKDVPQSGDSGIVTFAAAPTVDSAGLVSWTISHRPLTDTVATIRTGETQLMTCAVPLMDQYPIQSIVFIAVVFMALMHGFSTGYRP